MMRNVLYAVLAMSCLGPNFSTAREQEEVILWPDGVPEPQVPADPAESLQTGTDGLTRRFDVSNPRLIIHRAARATATGAAIIIVPGGGFGRLADEHEGSDAAKWLNQHGITALQLVYRTPTRKHSSPVLGPAQDLQKALLLARQKSDMWSIDRNRIGVIGFSAGGQTALVASAGKPVIDFAGDPQELRPNALLLIYPYQVVDSKTGEVRGDIDLSSGIAPTFIAQAVDDSASPPDGSARLFLELLKNKVPSELHIYQTGGHGFGLRPRTNAPGARDWSGRAVEWLRMHSFASPETRPETETAR